MAEQPVDRVDPLPIWPSLINPFPSAVEAFAAGNYPLALAMAPAGSALHAASMVMCGAIAPGQTALASFASEEMRLVRAYAHWCLDQTTEARAVLDGLRRGELAHQAAQLAELIESPPDIALITIPGSSHAGRFQVLEGFRVHPIQLEPADFGITMVDALRRLPAGAHPRMIIGIDAYGPYLPRITAEVDIPFVLWAGDHDFFFATRHADLARADVIVVNSAGEQIEMGHHYEGRIAAFPGHESYQQIANGATRRNGSADVVFTGRAFAPYMRDKAQMLFRLSVLDDPTLSVEIVDGYLPESDYGAMLARARNVPIFWRYAGGMQTRAIEALRAGACVLSPEHGIARPLLGAAAPAYRSLIGEDAETLLATPVRRSESAAHDLVAVYWSSPAREARFLKYCLFQTILAQPRRGRRDATPFVAAEQRGYDRARGLAVYSRIVRLNSESDVPGGANFIHAAAAAFYAAISIGESGTDVGKMALDFYRSGIQAFPQSLALRFNAARALWTFGLRAEAVAQFHDIVERLPDLVFDARSDALLSHRVRALADMFPYGDFFRAAVGGADARARSSGPREFMASASLAYLAADLIERREPAAAAALLRRAIERCDVNVAAWRLLTRALGQSGGRAEQIRAAFYRTVNLYPPELLNLLSIGLEAEMADGRTVAAGRLLRKWVMLRTRVHDASGNPIAASDDATAAARRYRALLSDWTGNLLDRMVAAR